MSSSSRNRFARWLPAAGASAAVLSLLLAACGGGESTSSAPASSIAVSSAPSASPEPDDATPSAEPIASAAAVELCLPAEIITAIEDLTDPNFEPSVPFSKIADAVEGLDVSGLDDPSFAELLRDDLVEKLRDPENEGLGRAAAGFESELLEEVREC